MTVLEMLKEMLAKEIEEHGPESAVAKDLARQIAEPDDGDDHIHVVMIKGDRPEIVRRRQLENAAQNDAEAQFEFGVMYDTGEGAPQSHTEAAKWYRKAAEQGWAKAQHNLGHLYENGEGVPQDCAEAVKWYRMAADQGVTRSQYNLGFMYDYGEGIAQDFTEALKWYRKAADGGHADAKNKLGVMCARGQGVPRDYTEAFRLFRESADQGNARAYESLGAGYRKGEGVPQDYVQAYKWYSLAVSEFAASESMSVERATTRLNTVAAKMTEAQIVEAQRLAREWKPGMP